MIIQDCRRSRKFHTETDSRVNLEPKKTSIQLERSLMKSENSYEKTNVDRQKHRMNLLRHLRHKSFEISNFKQKLRTDLRDHLDKNDDYVKQLTQSNTKCRQERQMRCRQLRQSIQTYKSAEAQALKRTLSQKKRKSIEIARRNEHSKLVYRKKEQLDSIYRIDSINSTEVQQMYIAHIDKELQKLPYRMRRVQNLIKMKGRIEHSGLQPKLTFV